MIANDVSSDLMQLVASTNSLAMMCLLQLHDFLLATVRAFLGSGNLALQLLDGLVVDSVLWNHRVIHAVCDDRSLLDTYVDPYGFIQAVDSRFNLANQLDVHTIGVLNDPHQRDLRLRAEVVESPSKTTDPFDVDRTITMLE